MREIVHVQVRRMLQDAVNVYVARIGRNWRRPVAIRGFFFSDEHALEITRPRRLVSGHRGALVPEYGV